MQLEHYFFLLYEHMVKILKFQQSHFHSCYRDKFCGLNHSVSTRSVHTRGEPGEL